MRTTTTRYIPKGAEESTFDDIKVTVYRFNNPAGEPAAIAYKGRSGKAAWRFKFADKHKRDEYISKYVMNQRHYKQEAEKEKAERKAKEEEARKSIKVGDIFHNSWGYDQTNCDFYQLVKISPSGKTGYFRPIHGKGNGEALDNAMSAKLKACKDDFIGEEILSRRLNGKWFKVDDVRGHASLVKDPEKQTFYSSWYA